MDEGIRKNLWTGVLRLTESHGDFLTKYYIDSSEKFARCAGIVIERGKNVGCGSARIRSIV